MAQVNAITNKDSQEYLTAVNNASKYSSSLTKSSNFTSYEQMRFNQVKGYNDFSQIEKNAQSEADYRKAQLDVQNSILERLNNLEKLQTKETADTQRLLDVQKAVLSNQLKEAS